MLDGCGGECGVLMQLLEMLSFVCRQNAGRLPIALSWQHSQQQYGRITQPVVQFSHSSPLCVLVCAALPLQKSNNSRTFWYTGLEVLVLLLVTGVNLAVTTGFFKGGPSRITV